MSEVLELVVEPISLELIAPAALNLVVAPTQPVVEVVAAPITVSINTGGASLAAFDARLDALEALLNRIGQAKSTDGSYGLPAPTGVGFEFVIVDDALDDVQMNGVSL